MPGYTIRESDKTIILITRDSRRGRRLLPIKFESRSANSCDVTVTSVRPSNEPKDLTRAVSGLGHNDAKDLMGKIEKQLRSSQRSP